MKFQGELVVTGTLTRDESERFNAQPRRNRTAYPAASWFSPRCVAEEPALAGVSKDGARTGCVVPDHFFAKFPER
jgi:hypothetical protein